MSIVSLLWFSPRAMGYEFQTISWIPLVNRCFSIYSSIYLTIHLSDYFATVVISLCRALTFQCCDVLLQCMFTGTILSTSFEKPHSMLDMNWKCKPRLRRFSYKSIMVNRSSHQQNCFCSPELLKWLVNMKSWWPHIWSLRNLDAVRLRRVQSSKCSKTPLYHADWMVKSCAFCHFLFHRRVIQHILLSVHFFWLFKCPRYLSFFWMIQDVNPRVVEFS